MAAVSLSILYDEDCGFCRWSVVVVARLVPDAMLVSIQSPLGAELLADLTPDERLRSAHVIVDGKRESAGAAGAALAEQVSWLRPVGRLARRFPRLADRGYHLVADRRIAISKLVPRASKERADRRLAAMRRSTP